MIDLRPYQKECIDAILSSKSEGITRPLASLATGLGKTVIFSALARELNCKTLILAHRDELLHQAREKIQMIWPEVSVGIVKAELQKTDAQIVIASIQTATRIGRLEALKAVGFSLCVIDEAHHAAAPTYEKLVRHLGFLSDDPEKLLLGVTATPKRGDGVGLSSIFQSVVFHRGISWGIKQGYLSPLVGRRISTQVSLSGVQSQSGDFVGSQLSSAINIQGRNKLIVDAYLLHANDRKKTIAFCVDVRHSHDLAYAFREAGVSSASIHGGMPSDERKQVLSKFEDGSIKVLTNCSVLTEGFDCPMIDSILLCRPTQSIGLYAQCVGRGTRRAPGKKDCLVIDFVDASRHTLCNFQNSLEGAVLLLDEDGKKKERNRKEKEDCDLETVNISFEMTGVEEIDFFGRSQFSWIQVGDAWHLPVSDRKDIWVRKASHGYRMVLYEEGVGFTESNQELPLDYAIGVAEDWIRTQREQFLARKDAKWRNEPASEKQIAALERFGIRDKNLTKGDASDLLRVKFNSKNGQSKIYCLK